MPRVHPFSRFMPVTLPTQPDPVRSGASSIFLPKEHGSWSLVLEPVVLGLLVAPSSAGGAFALAAFAGFLARRPVKAALVPAFSEQRCAARRTVVMFSALAVAGVFLTVVSVGLAPLWPLVLVAPLGGLFAWFDTQGESRAAAAELAGSAAYALLPAVFSTIAGWNSSAALALAAIALARSVPTVLTVRTYLRLAKGQAVKRLLPSFVAGLAVIVLGTLQHFTLVPVAAVIAVSALLGRSLWLLSSRRPVWSASRLGRLEAVLGVLYVVVIALAYQAA